MTSRRRAGPPLGSAKRLKCRPKALSSVASAADRRWRSRPPPGNPEPAHLKHPALGAYLCALFCLFPDWFRGRPLEEIARSTPQRDKPVSVWFTAIDRGTRTRRMDLNAAFLEFAR